MKILHIGKYYPPYFGGIEKVNFDCVEGLNKKGHHVDVFCFNDKFKTEIEEGDYKIYRMSRIIQKFSTPISFSFFFKLRKVVNNYDIVHLHLPNPVAAILYQLSGFKGKLVLHWHSDIVKQKLLKLVYGPFQRILLKRAKAILVTTPNYLEGSEDLCDFKSKSYILPIGIDHNELPKNEPFYNQLLEEYKGKKVIFSLGRLTYYKGFDYLIKAANFIDDDTVIIIGGDGELKNVLKELIARNNLESKVKLLGKIPFEEISSYFRRADVFCLPSNEKSEAFGVVLIEAMSFGCAIVACAIKGSGVPWVNQDKETGINVKPHDVYDLSDGLKAVLNNEEDRQRYSKNAVSRYEKMFTVDKMVNQLDQIYTSL